MEKESDEPTVKITLVGDAKVGKSALVATYLSSNFTEVYDPTIFDTFEGSVRIAEKTLSFSICDVAGSPTYDKLDLKKLRSVCYLDTDVFIICFSVVDRKSFEHVKTEWYPEVTDKGPAHILLVGLKTDLRDEILDSKDKKKNKDKIINNDEIEDLAKNIASLGYLECSAKKTEGFKEVFDTAIRAAYLNLETAQKKSDCLVM
eukprot:TRINITY_DN5397_c0_g1_i1.p1 TRINITY_DN5397_c0_g1~~TRINITY_DN5397_c0_g1_i1.p1  ORF type:complete len:203 (-),score=34.27 TRINITY_DN5397_c0_g1_i1:164-772(-)